ncbi:MAG: DUF3108 domain-containing protein [Endomicrobium sp.]|jgi:hypothetical protein|nr:DUF3108 domain-containing protein [Endomicrobium sp.]MDR2399143.1 DUF3108 domain-containing protein [Endomicrobium sp.]
MIKRTKLIIALTTVVFILLPLLCFAQNNVEIFNKSHSLTRVGKYKLPTNEKLTYIIKWSSMDFGDAILETEDFKSVGGKKAYNVRLRVTTNPFLNSLFNLNAEFESLFDEESKESFEFKSKIKQNGHESEEVIIFNPIEETYELRTVEGVRRGQTSRHTQDILSAICSLRCLALKPGDIYNLKVHLGELSYPLRVKVLRKEKIKIRLGEFNCFVVELTLEGNSKDLGLNGKMLVWIVDNKKKPPCYFKLESQIGLIIAELESITTL